MRKALIALALVATMITVGCSTAWVSTLDSILSAAAPALIAILQIAAVSRGASVDGSLVSKINADAAAVKATAADFASASSSAAPGACSQLQAALSTYQADLPAVLAVAQVSNSNTQNKIETLSALIIGVFGTIQPLIPSCQAPALAQARASLKFAAPPLNLKNFVSTYNTVLTEKSNDAAVDAITPKLRLHRHSKAVRVLTFGMAQ